MKLSHIIYKVNNLHTAVEEFKNKGFVVEYGTIKNPYNALIYFSNGPYLELLASTGMPSFAKKMLRLFGKNKIVDRLDFWDNHNVGPCGLHLENYSIDLNKEKDILKKYNQKFFQMNAGRKDTKGRHLKFKCLFPDELGIPSLMTYFNIDPKPNNFVHPNGVSRIKNISFGTKKEFIPVINELCDDDTLNLFISKNPGDEIDLSFEYVK